MPPKQFRVKERKGREGARAKKMQKGVQSIPNCQRSSGFQLLLRVSACFSEISRGTLSVAE